MNEDLFVRVIKGLETCIRKDCENCDYHKNFIHGCEKMIVEAKELILKQKHDLETLQNFCDKQEKVIWDDTWIPHDECW